MRTTPTWVGLAALTMMLAAGCGSLEDALSPGRRADAAPARVALAARLPALSVGRMATLQLRVEAFYGRTDGTRVRLTTQATTLDDAPTQQVPITIDLAPCLADPQRATGVGGACVVSLDVSLVEGERVVDRQTIGPLSLTAGGTATVAEPVQLVEVAGVRVGAGGGAGSGDGSAGEAVVRLELGASITLGAAVTSTAGRAVSGRALTWSSDAPAVARVDAATGVVLGVGIGRARITATTLGGSGGVDVAVVPRPSAIRVSGTGVGGSGLVRSVPAGIDCRVAAGQAQGACEFTFPGDARVTLAVTPDFGATFAGWGGACALSGGAATCELDAAQPRAATVSFSALRRLSVGGTGAGTITGAPGGIDCRLAGGTGSGTCGASYADGAVVALTAAAGAQATFAGWTGACAGVSGPQCTVTMSADLMVGARFSAPLALTVASDGEGGGTVAGAGLACTFRAGAATPCVTTLAFGAVVTLAATPDASSEFTGWTGACTGTGACQVTMDQTRSVGATFARRRVTLALSLGGGGRGTLKVGAQGSCAIATDGGSASCQLSVVAGEPVTLVAVPASGATFAGWSGACAGRMVDSCVLTPTADVALGARFITEMIPLSATGAQGATGGGRVTGGGLECALTGAAATGTCETSVPYASSVTLVAVPNATSTFGGWGGACHLAVGPHCTVAPTVASSVTARFDVMLLPLAVTRTGAGNGAVTSGPTGVDCPGTCTATFPAGTTITLTATPDASSEFAGWSGACAGASGPQCAVTMSAAASVVASFTPRPPPPPPPPPPSTYTLDVVFTGNGAGTVTSVPAGIACQATCRATFPAGTVVVLTAQAAAGPFRGWSGSCAGSAACVVTMSEARTVTALFRQ